MVEPIQRPVHSRHRQLPLAYAESSVAPWEVEAGCRSYGPGPQPPIRLDHGCAAKTWATPPPLKTVVLIGAMVSGARKIRGLANGPEALGQ